MTITQIECFVEVAKFGNVSRAAESLFITQQAVSGQIKSLEKELGFPLFERKSKGVALTKEGEILFADWEQIRNTLRISIDKARDYHSGRNISESDLQTWVSAAKILWLLFFSINRSTRNLPLTMS